MKLLFLILINSTIIFAAIDKKLLENKNKNYITMKKIYLELKTPITKQDKNTFCTIVNNNIEHMSNMYSQDTKLVIHLRENEYFEYAKHIEENSATDLLTFFSYRNICNESSINFAELKESLDRNLINLNFLTMYHQQFMTTIE